MFSEQLKKYRTLAHLTQQQVADYLCITQTCYQYYEKGKREPSIEIIKNLCKLFECSPNELLEFEASNNSKMYINHSFNNNRINIKK